MIHFTSGQLIGWIMLFFWPFVRILAFVAVMPILNQSEVPRTAKIGIAAMLAFLIAPTLASVPDVAPLSYPGVWLIVQQILIGVAMGLVMRVVFAAVQAAGEFIGLQMGLSFASFYSAALAGNTMVLGRLLNLFAVLFFLALNVHLIMLHVLARTFVLLPIAAGGVDPGAWRLLVDWGGTVFTAGVALALPLIAALLTINMALGILNRASPQLTIFSIGFPLTLLTGVLMLWFMTPELGGLFSHMFANGLGALRRLTGALAGG